MPAQFVPSDKQTSVLFTRKDPLPAIDNPLPNVEVVASDPLPNCIVPDAVIFLELSTKVYPLTLNPFLKSVARCSMTLPPRLCGCAAG